MICGPLRMVFFRPLVLESDMACHEIILRSLSFCPEEESISDKWSSVHHLID